MIWACSMRQRGSEMARSFAGTSLNALLVEIERDAIAPVADGVGFNLDAELQCLRQNGIERARLVDQQAGASR